MYNIHEYIYYIMYIYIYIHTDTRNQRQFKGVAWDEYYEKNRHTSATQGNFGWQKNMYITLYNLI